MYKYMKYQTLKLVYFLKNGSCCYLKSPYFFKLMAKHIVTEWKSWGSIGSKKFKHIVSINNDFLDQNKGY